MNASGRLPDLQQVAVHRLSVQGGIDVHFPVGVVHGLDLKHILHVSRHQSEIDLRESEEDTMTEEH